MSDFRLGDLIQAIDENKEAMNVQLTGSNVPLGISGKTASGEEKTVSVDKNGVQRVVTGDNVAPVKSIADWFKVQIDFETLREPSNVYKVTVAGSDPSLRVVSSNGANNLKIDKRYKKVQFGLHVYEINNSSARLHVRFFRKDGSTMPSYNETIDSTGWKSITIEVPDEAVDANFRLYPGSGGNTDHYVIVSDPEIKFTNDSQVSGEFSIAHDPDTNEAVKLAAVKDPETGHYYLPTVEKAPAAYDDVEDKIKTTGDRGLVKQETDTSLVVNPSSTVEPYGKYGDIILHHFHIFIPDSANVRLRVWIGDDWVVFPTSPSSGDTTPNPSSGGARDALVRSGIFNYEEVSGNHYFSLGEKWKEKRITGEFKIAIHNPGSEETPEIGWQIVYTDLQEG